MDDKTRKKREEQIKRLEEMQEKYIEKLNEIIGEIYIKGRLIFLWFKGIFLKKQKNFE